MLTIERIRNLIKPVCDEYPINKVYLFGSYSRGDAKESSDVDLRIEGDIHNLFTLGGIYEDMQEALGVTGQVRQFGASSEVVHFFLTLFSHKVV